jgi:endonuclease/exonuclease/phosphatase family metal-dependent hydrolase
VMPAAAVLCGDFNCEPDSSAWQAIVAEHDSESPWRDAWLLCHGDVPHPPSVGVHGADWPDRPYCCDYMFVSQPLAAAVRNVCYDALTDASDHQPVLVDLDLSLIV